MGNLIKQEPTFLVHKATRHGTLIHEAPESLTKEQRVILKAYTEPAIYTISDMELLPKISGMIGRALIELGHKNSLNDDAEFKIMQDAIYSDIRERYDFFSVQDIELVFKFGARGDFKSKPDDVVFLNREQVNKWLKCYHGSKRADVVASLKPAGPKKEAPPDYNPETDFGNLLQKIKSGAAVTDTEWICQTAQHYDRLNNAGSFNITNEERKAIFQEERNRLIENGKNRMLHVNTETRFMFRAFMESQPGENQYQKEVATICRIRVFREYVEALAKTKAA